MTEGGPSTLSPEDEQALDTRQAGAAIARVQLTDAPDKASASEHADDTKASTLAVSLSSEHEKKTPSASGVLGDSTNDESTHSRPRRAPSKRSSLMGSKKSKSLWSSILSVLLPCISPSHTRAALDDDDEATLPRKTDNNEMRRPDLGPVPEDNEKLVLGHIHEPSSSTTATAIRNPTPPPLDSSTIIAPPLVVPANIETAFDDPESKPPEIVISSHELENVTSSAVQPPGSTGEDPEASDAGSSIMDEDSEMDAYEEDEADRLIRNGGAGIPRGPNGELCPLLGTLLPAHQGRKCLVLDLDETLVHSSMKYVAQADYVVPVEIEDQWYNFYVLKRPGVDEFLKEMGKIFEVVVFTASLSKYADPVLDHLDVHGVVTHRLFRESCYNHRGNYVKDLSQLGRPIEHTIILDNSPASYIFHPKNAAPVSSWFNDPHDRELMDLSPFLADLATVDDVRGILDIYI